MEPIKNCNCEHILLSVGLSQQRFVMLFHPQLQTLNRSDKAIMQRLKELAGADRDTQNLARRIHCECGEHWFHFNN